MSGVQQVHAAGVAAGIFGLNSDLSSTINSGFCSKAGSWSAARLRLGALFVPDLC